MRVDHKRIARFVNLAPGSVVYKSAGWLRDWLYPPNCLLCGDDGHAGMDLCAACHAELPWNRHACRQCALPMPADQDATVCGQCLSDPPPFDRAVAPLVYAPVSAWLIAGLKFRRQLGHARLLAQLLSGTLNGIDPPDRLLPVPLHRRRLRERGYNQALEIARPLARQYRLPLDIHSVRRVKATAPQSSMGLKDRRRNIRGAFVCSTSLQDQHVAIMDDVATSTATARELAGVLRRAGAARVSLWCVARAPAPAMQ